MNKEEINEIDTLEIDFNNIDELNLALEVSSKKTIYLLDEFSETIIKLQQENEQLKELYEKTCKHLFDIGNDELARYFKAQIDENNTFMVGDM